MILPFFIQAAQSPTRQRAFRSLVVAHLVLVALLAGGVSLWRFPYAAVLIGNALLVAAIVEGALLLGWRLTQLPKSQALEFLLVSQVRPAAVLLGEALVGVVRLAYVTLSSLPLLVLLVLQGVILFEDVATILSISFLWGAVTGLGLTTWAYEPPGVRRWGERLVGCLILLYLIIGVLAAEHLPLWLEGLPAGTRSWLLGGFRALHEYNPFGVMRSAMELDPVWTGYRIGFVQVLGVSLCLVFLLRASCRLKAHFHEEHYRPVKLDERQPRPPIPDQPLAWWAVRRVTKYSGRINLWLAGGFALLYAAFLVAEPYWPSWLGRHVFMVFEGMGGVPVVTTALVLLAAVPAAFQYGVWDSSVQDRCRRLELLLLTDLDGASYWHASVRAAWQRGRGYFLVALLLWSAALIAGRASLGQVLVSVAAGMILWALYFALGFWAFARGTQGGALGLFLTVGLPVITILFGLSQLPWAAALLPPGSIYQPMASVPGWAWLVGPVLAGASALALARYGLATCDESLRRWYATHHGAR
jgi:hypothetical protein